MHGLRLSGAQNSRCSILGGSATVLKTAPPTRERCIEAGTKATPRPSATKLHLAGIDQELTTGRRRHYAIGRALEQGRAELFLQRRDLAAQGRLPHVQPFRRPAEMAGAGKFAEITELVVAILTISVLFAVAVILVEAGLQTEHRPGLLLIGVGKALLRNPLLVAPILGALWSASGSPLPAALKTFLHLVGDAASPCALVSLGLFLATKHKGAPSGRPAAVAFTLLKLVGQPAITALRAYGIFRIAALPAVAVLVSALPTGTGPFMIAEFYKREAVVKSATILFSTIASVVTVTACLLLIGPVR